MKTAFLIDSTTGFAQEYAQRDDIFEVTLSVVFPNDETLPDSRDIQTITDKFLELRKEFDEKPHTSQPSVGNIQDAFDKIVEQGYERVIGIMLGSKMSGTFQSANIVAEDYKDKLDIHLFDSHSAVTANYALIEEAIRLVELDTEMSVITDRINQLIKDIETYILPENLAALQRGGRFEATEEAVVALNNTKNILYFKEEGTMNLLEKVRSARRREVRLIELIEDGYQKFDGNIQIIISHANAYEEMVDFKNKIQEVFPKVSVRIIDMLPTIICHVDEKGYFVSVIPN
ncbi:DegV family protein [Aerococcaceae bacterium DSM 111176]|nr:DegV family protein [Aerococcaceae bacterium DSM 111176]